MTTRKFETEVNQLLHLIIHSLYSHKEIFLRELISNASDALDKLKLLNLTDEAYKKIDFDPRIDISFNADDKILSVSDTGIGMNENDLVEQIGTIAKSGTSLVTTDPAPIRAPSPILLTPGSMVTLWPTNTSLPISIPLRFISASFFA